MTDREMLAREMLLIDATDISSLGSERLRRAVDLCSGARLGRVLSSCSGESLERALSSCSGESLERVLSLCSDESLERVLSLCSDERLERIVSLCSEERLGGFEAPTLSHPYTQVLAAIRAEGCALRMNSWHQCDTTHCLGGWVTALCGEAGAKLESKVGMPAAPRLILAKSRPGVPLPNFYSSDEAAMVFIETRAAEEAVANVP